MQKSYQREFAGAKIAAGKVRREGAHVKGYGEPSTPKWRMMENAK
jgi:hypothetical protein